MTDMKKNFLRPILASTATLCIGISLPFLLGNDRFDPEVNSVRSDVSHFTASPSVPDQVSFAGQTIHMDRYDHRERMDRELMSFTYMHSTTLLSLKRIESGLNHLAKSPAGAAGMWQFMQGTGRQYGLEVNQNIDERYNIEKATRAACKYLKESYEKYGNWLCVAAAYNAGQGRITQQLQRQMVDQAADLWLVEETSRYMFRLLAAKAVFTDPQRYGFMLKREQLYPPIACTTVTVTKGIDNLAQFAQSKGITYAQLKDFNPWLRDTSLMNKSGRTYVLKIPTRAGMHYNPKKTVAHNRRWVID